MTQNKKSIKIQVMSIEELRSLSTNIRINKILSIVKDNKIILLDGNLEPNEEAELIKDAMKNVNKKFPGIEIGVLRLERNSKNLFVKMRSLFEKLILGHKRGITIIGPANLVKEIKEDPEKAILLMELKK